MDDEIAAKQVLLDFELVTLIALALGAFVYALARRLRPALAGGAAVPEEADYDGFDFVLMFFPAMFFLLGPILEVIEMRRAAADPGAAPAEHTVNGLTILTFLAFYAFIGVMTYGLIEWVRNRRVADLFGLGRLRGANIVVISILGGITSLLLCNGLVGDFSNHYLDELFGKLELQAPVRMLQETDSDLQLALTVAVACVAAPLVEEFLFRGYIYGTVRQMTHPLFAAVVTGALFTVVHGNLPALLPLWAFSLLLCFAYEWTGCLWVPVGMHAFFNAANIVSLLGSEPVT